MATSKGPTARRAGLSRDAVLDQALELSRAQGVEGWSMRELARALGVVPSVVYHYFPQKEDLCDAVVDAVCAEVPLPDPSLAWKEWFTALLGACRPVLLRYPGVADRLVAGRVTRGLLPVVDTAVGKLRDAGFGRLTPLAYSIILSVALSAISARNLRTHTMHGVHHDLPAMVARLTTMRGASPGLDFLLTELFEPVSRPEESERIGQDYFDLVVASMLDGIEHVLLPKAAGEPGPGPAPAGEPPSR